MDDLKKELASVRLASEALRKRLRCDFVFLSDQQGTLLDALNIRHLAGRESDRGDGAYPTQVLVDGQRS